MKPSEIAFYNYVLIFPTTE